MSYNMEITFCKKNFLASWLGLWEKVYETRLEKTGLLGRIMSMGK